MFPIRSLHAHLSTMNQVSIISTIFLTEIGSLTETDIYQLKISM